ncbi:MAG: CbiX/SirB N-terminal domain-containing protein [Bryobacteraceae bacterium]|nr:CbiX/SirB N-terminal domain-containing protein [Bryobacteraceae bacterium]
MTTGIVLFAHGSSVESANESVRAVAASVAAEGGFPVVETAFLEMAEPTLVQAVERLVARQIGRIVVIPYFLTLGIHLRRDLPRIVEECMGRHPGVSIEVTEPLDGHPALRQIVLDRAKKAGTC